MTGTPYTCRSCGGINSVEVLSLGDTPLANSLLKPEQLAQPEPRFPLDLAVCPDCALVQITESVPPDALFREYLYFSSFSDTMLHHARALVERLIPAHRLTGESLVVEIASNDGYLLQYFRRRGIGVLGVEPAELFMPALAQGLTVARHHGASDDVRVAA